MSPGVGSPDTFGSQNMGNSCAGVYKIAPGASIPDRGPSTVISVWILFALATIFIGLRLYSKKSRSNGFWWDDYVLIVSWACFVADAAFSQSVVSLGLGKYPCNIDPRNFVPLGLLANFGTFFGVLAVVWSKTSFAMTLLRLTEEKTKLFVWFTIVSMNIFMIFEALIVWIQCNPVKKTWDPRIPGTCWDREAVNGYGVFSGVYSGVMDITLAILPWKLIWNLQMKRREKIGVGVAMSMGVFAGTTAFVKSSQIRSIGSDNFTYNGAPLLVWAAAEMSTTIMAASLPMLRVFIRDAHKSSANRHKNSSGLGPYQKGTGNSTGGNQTFGVSAYAGSMNKSLDPSDLQSPLDSPQFIRGDSGSDSDIIILPVKGILVSASDLEAVGNRHILQTHDFAVSLQPRYKKNDTIELTSVRTKIHRNK